MSKTAIKIENLTKAYRLGQIGTGTISHDLNRFFAKVMGKEDPMSFVGNTKDRQSQVKYIKVLDDINLEVEKGQILGIIGKNGAGKSTLLKIISQITTPTSGRVKYKGKIASLLEVGTGMHQEMTARENIYLNGSILGMKKKDIDKKFDDIIDFSGCSLFVDTPVKRFSSGMRVRLGFAVAAFLDPDILIVDEVLAVGDYEFQKNAVGKIKEVSSNEGRTVLFVSHNMGSIKNICDSGIVLNNGKLIHENKNISNLVNFYQNQSISKNNDISLVKRDGLGNIIFADFKILNKNGEESSQFCSGDTIRFQMTLKSEITEKVAVQIAIGIKSTDDRICSMLANEYLDKTLYVENGINQVFCCLENIPFSFGKFSINLIVKRNQITEDWIKELTFFEILGGGYLTESYTYPESYRGVYLKHEWYGK